MSAEPDTTTSSFQYLHGAPPGQQAYAFQAQRHPGPRAGLQRPLGQPVLCVDDVRVVEDAAQLHAAAASSEATTRRNAAVVTQKPTGT